MPLSRYLILVIFSMSFKSQTNYLNFQIPFILQSILSQPNYLNLSQQLSADLFSSLLIIVHFLPNFQTSILNLSISSYVHFPFLFRLLKFLFKYLQQLYGDLFGRAVDRIANIFWFLANFYDLSLFVKRFSNYSRDMSFETKNFPTASDKALYQSLSNFPFFWFQMGSFHFFSISAFKGRTPSKLTDFIYFQGSFYFKTFFFTYSSDFYQNQDSLIRPFLRIDFVCQTFSYSSQTSTFFSAFIFSGLFYLFLSVDFYCLFSVHLISILWGFIYTFFKVWTFSIELDFREGDFQRVTRPPFRSQISFPGPSTIVAFPRQFLTFTNSLNPFCRYVYFIVIPYFF